MDFRDYRYNSVIKGKKVLITGGTTGIGRAIAVLLAGQGAKVMVFGRNEKDLLSALKDIHEISGAEAYGLTADSSSKDGLIRVYDEVDKKLEGLDILINNAGIGGGNLVKADYEEWKKILDTNVLGYLAFTKYALDRMLPNKVGHIVNIGSFSAVDRGADHEVYVASKAAVQAFSESLRKTYNPKGIKVSLIEPGSVGTDMPSETPEEQRKLEAEGKMLASEEIAQAVLFCLLQPERSEVTTIQIKPHKQFI
jgi:NADP-dependent 3-hydroxy acid dehydrogenase YdfG